MAATIAWHPALPDKPPLGTRFVPRSTALRTEMSVGPDKVRQVTTAEPGDAFYTFALNEVQAELLLTFYNVTTKAGAIPFFWDHPVTDARVDMRFAEPPSLVCVAGASAPGLPIWTATVHLEVLPT